METKSWNSTADILMSLCFNSFLSSLLHHAGITKELLLIHIPTLDFLGSWNNDLSTWKGVILTGHWPFYSSLLYLVNALAHCVTFYKTFHVKTAWKHYLDGIFTFLSSIWFPIAVHKHWRKFFSNFYHAFFFFMHWIYNSLRIKWNWVGDIF